jgi:hypothetical protein
MKAVYPFMCTDGVSAIASAEVYCLNRAGDQLNRVRAGTAGAGGVAGRNGYGGRWRVRDFEALSATGWNSPEEGIAAGIVVADDHGFVKLVVHHDAENGARLAADDNGPSARRDQ